MNKSASITELAKALCAMQLELENATKSSENPFFKSKYADLAEVLRCIKEVAMKHGLSFTQMPSYEQNTVFVETMLMHSSGEWISSVCGSPAPKLDPQGIGSAITYLRRYSLASVFGLAQEDDDANGQQGTAPASEEIDLPWFNDFDNMAVKFKESIDAGERTPDQIIKNLCKGYKVSKQVREQIKQLGAK